MRRYTKKFMFLCDGETYLKLVRLAEEEKSSKGWVLRRLVDEAYDKIDISPSVDKRVLSERSLK